MSDRTPPCVAITGAAGFLGSHVAEALARTGMRLRLHIGAPSDHRESPSVTAECRIVADVDDRAAISALLQGGSPVTTVVHAAGPPSVRDSFIDPTEYMRIHAVGTAVILDACVRAGVQRFVHISSAETYGNRSIGRVDEAAPQMASSPYAAAKIGAEQIVRAMAMTGQLTAIAVRPFSVYGPRMSTTGVVADFFAQAMQGKPITVRDPRPVRDFCYVADVASAIALAAVMELQDSGDAFTAINLGSGVGTTIAELASAITTITDGQPWTSGLPDRPAGAEMTSLIADISAAQRVLGWAPTTTLSSGLQCTRDWMRAK